MSIKKMLYLAANYTPCVDAGQAKAAEDIEREFEELLSQFIENQVRRITAKDAEKLANTGLASGQ